jgi:hypothetical protein
MGLLSMIKRIFAPSSRAVAKVEEADQRSREIKHALRNMAMRSTALCQLVSKMREDEAWRRPRENNDKSA